MFVINKHRLYVLHWIEKRIEDTSYSFVRREGERERVSHLWLSWRYFDGLHKTTNISAGGKYLGQTSSFSIIKIPKSHPIQKWCVWKKKNTKHLLKIYKNNHVFVCCFFTRIHHWFFCISSWNQNSESAGFFFFSLFLKKNIGDFLQRDVLSSFIKSLSVRLLHL